MFVFRPFGRIAGLIAVLLALASLYQPVLSQYVECASHIEAVSVIEPSCHARGLHGHSSVCGGDPKSDRMPAFCRASSRTYELGILRIRFPNVTALAVQEIGLFSKERRLSRSPSAEEFSRVVEVHCDENHGKVDPQTGLSLPPLPVRFRALPTGPTVVSAAPPVVQAHVQDHADLKTEQQIMDDMSYDATAVTSGSKLAGRACASGLCCLGTPDWHGGPVFVLPKAFPHSETSPALFLNSLQSKLGDRRSEGVDLEIALVLSASTLSHQQHFLSPEAIQSCRVIALPPSRQTSFPPIRLLAERKRVNRQGHSTKSILRPISPVIRCRGDETFDAQSYDDDYVGDLVEEYSLVIATPEIDVLQGDLSDTSSLASGKDAESVPGSVSFLQVDAFQKFVGTSVKATINPMLHILQDMTSLDTATTMSSQIRAALLERTTKQVVFLTRDPIRRNITNQVVDSTAIVLNRVLHKSLPITLTPYIADHVTKWTPPLVLKHLQPVLEEALTYDLVRVIPPILNRALPLSLEYSLNRAITHAVVPSVSAALSRSTTAGHYCYLCYYHNKACFLCNSSPESQYYLSYYSTYFSDYYSDYYTPYYFGAINKVVNRDNPDALPESTGFADQKGNIWPQ